ncbi:unnamed protein product [Mytilus edulis]|uniref:Uncharacterized protein n=1 Tax=Mytilus edulis TaxID=6550 RepID=A0A8S3SJ38_MYTED|nr:unnamed protein product [Mytilus edulis]
MSSDEECADRFITHKPSWQSEKFAEYKRKLDSKFLDICSTKSRRLLTKSEPKLFQPSFEFFLKESKQLYLKLELSVKGLAPANEYLDLDQTGYSSKFCSSCSDDVRATTHTPYLDESKKKVVAASYREEKHLRTNTKNRRKQTLFMKAQESSILTSCSVFMKIVDNDLQESFVFSTYDLYSAYQLGGLKPNSMEERLTYTDDNQHKFGLNPVMSSPIKNTKDSQQNCILPGGLEQLPVL